MRAAIAAHLRSSASLVETDDTHVDARGSFLQELGELSAKKQGIVSFRGRRRAATLKGRSWLSRTSPITERPI